MENGPIEISRKDIIPRPAVLPGKTPTPDQGLNIESLLKTLKGSMSQVKEIVDLAKSMGIDVNLPGGLGAALKGKGQDQGPGKEPDRDQGAPSPAQQVQNFIALLRMRYGDITVNECLDRLRADLGNKKLSEFGNFRP